MALGAFSRYRFSTAQLDAEGRLYLGARPTYGYRELDDNRLHIARAGDSWWTLAARYFEGVERPAGLWWVIADFQPIPIHDPTIEIAPGTAIVVPSLKTVLTRVLAESRRGEEP